MNLKALSKHYDQLTARERIALLIAASSRSDPLECQRLLSSAPKAHYSIPHHRAVAEALAEAASLHLLTRLDVAANFWQWWGLWGWSELRSHSRTTANQGSTDNASEAQSEEAEIVRLMCMVRYQAFLFVTHVEGWKQFCRDWPIEPEGLLQIKPGWDMAVRTEAQARQHAYSAQDAALFLLSEMFLPEGDADEELELPQVVTVQGLAQVWHTFIEHYLESHVGKD
jgi:hypothetical protein